MAGFDLLMNLFSPSTLAAGATSVGNLISTGMANAANERLAERANLWSIQQWQRENAYNDPRAQMSRLRAAGINPALAYTEGGIMNEAAPSPGVTSAAGTQRPYIMDPLTASQVNLNNSLADKHRSEKEFQDYMNDIERQLAHIPTGSVHTIDNNGNETYEVTYGNARVLIASEELKALRLSSNGLQYQLADLFYDLAVKCGSLDFTDSASFNPTEQPNFVLDEAAYRGDANVRKLASDLAQIGYEAAQAEKAGRQAYAKWLEEHKDEPIVKFALTLQGFFQSSGISLPSISHREGGYYSGGQFHPTSRSWFFGR